MIPSFFGLKLGAFFRRDPVSPRSINALELSSAANFVECGATLTLWSIGIEGGSTRNGRSVRNDAPKGREKGECHVEMDDKVMNEDEIPNKVHVLRVCE